MLVLFITVRDILRLFYIKFKFLLEVFLLNFGGCSVMVAFKTVDLADRVRFSAVTLKLQDKIYIDKDKGDNHGRYG